MKSLAPLFLLLALLTGACTGILDKEPIATLDAGSFFQTETDAQQALNAAYRPLLFSNPNNNFYCAFGVVPADEAIPVVEAAKQQIPADLAQRLQVIRWPA